MTSAALRKDLVFYCVEKLNLPEQFVNYLVILEANDNPYAVQERFNKELIDRAFDASRAKLMNGQA